MEYYLNLNLLVLNEWRDLPDPENPSTLYRIDMNDAAIAALIEKYEKTPNLEKSDISGGVWIDHGYLMKQLPLLNLTKRTIKRRLLKLWELSLIDSEIVHIQTTGIRKKAYYKMSITYRQMEKWWQKCLDIQANKETTPLDKDSAMQLLALEKPKITVRKKAPRRDTHVPTLGDTDVPTSGTPMSLDSYTPDHCTKYNSYSAKSGAKRRSGAAQNEPARIGSAPNGAPSRATLPKANTIPFIPPTDKDIHDQDRIKAREEKRRLFQSQLVSLQINPGEEGVVNG